MENQKSNSILFAILGCVLVLLLIFGVFVFCKKIAEKKEPDNNVVNGIGDAEVINDMAEFELIEANETHSFSDLELSFTATNDGDNDYEYVLSASYNGNNIDVSFLDNKIWSSNRAANFIVYRIDNVFILDSFRANQCDSDTLIIFNTKGEILKEFDSVSLFVDGNRLAIDDFQVCTVEEVEDNLKTYTFQVVDDNIEMF